jgi:hypothetical protein
VVSRLKSNEPVAESFSSTPSIMTSVCAGGAPRIETSAIVPGEPLCVTFRLGISRNASVTLWICCDWI